VHVHLFFTSALFGGEWLGEVKIVDLTGTRTPTPGHPTCSQSHYTDCATVAPNSYGTDYYYYFVYKYIYSVMYILFFLRRFLSVFC
jgi:hypothetical protein